MGNGNGLNTLEYVQKLEQAGMPRKQAEAQASVFYDLITSNLASKRDMKESENNLKRDMKESENNLKRDIKLLDVKIENVRAELKQDIKALDVKIESIKSDLKRDIKELEDNLKRDMKESEQRLIIRLGGIVTLIMTLGISIIALVVTQS